MDIENQQNQADIKDLDFSELVFRQIDRIMALSQKTYANDSDKLFDFVWSVRMLRALIPSEIKDKEFIETEKTLNSERETLLSDKKTSTSMHFDNVQKLFGACIDLLAKHGLLYRRNSNGSTSEF